MRWWWSRRKELQVLDPELEKATERVDDLDRRKAKLDRRNHLARDIKKALGAQ